MDTSRRAPQARRLSVPALHNFRFNQRARPNTLRRRRQPISRAALKSLAPLNLDIPESSVTGPPLHADPTPPPSLYLAVLSHLADLEARLSTSSSALQLLHQLRDEVAAYFPSLNEETPNDDTQEYDFEYDFGIRNALDFDFGSALDLDIDFDWRSRYAHLSAELSTLSLDEAKNKLYTLSTQSYDDAKSKFDSFKDRFVGEVRRWADGALPNIPTLPNIPDMHMPNISVLPMAIPDLHARLDELRAALPADLSSATDKLVSFVESLIEDDADGDVNWVDTRWKGLNIHPRGHEIEEDIALEGKGKERGDKVDLHALALEKSQGGKRLIRYRDLPEQWRNNEFVWEGYRFIPGARWTTLVFSMFQLHNETVNIQTHFVPLLAILSVIPVPWTSLFTQHSILSGFPTISQFDISSFGFTPFPTSPADPLPKFLFLLAAGACLTCSTIWHTLAGCSDFWLLEAGARIDYVGIGWLISASVSGVMYYGYDKHLSQPWNDGLTREK
ncbi:hemolysin-III channel protein [Rhizoctonia solani]|uniref:Hemolysin-III channel protein n=1 Tax=Rhizoctonia solani TaxID=456999 RepID=A0A8H7HD07_9AGAM|nr:hemolysin-III channel protein [Rhizoctonia solani]KAF8684272.1 hemolysin-III related [Rhizoctonia solani]KAF8750938.1 hemolysin-III related [Rhizoctonia solani]QRW24071.1 hemolysin-III channel protein [Rhizoctonia solani]